MIKQLLLLILILMFTGSATLAQKYSIRGSVAEQQGEVLPYASVFLLHVRDSSVVASTTTTAQGSFLLRDVKKGAYILKVSFVGYVPYTQKITTPAKGNILQLGEIKLQLLETELAAVTIVGEREAVLVKEDTVQYNAAAYQTRPNANVEQLLRKLPGLELQQDGNIRVQGQPVTRIFVDGKEFFGGDVQMATKNLPADAIEKVEVIDGKSEEARFSGIDDGKREKVINLTLKEENKSMGFGKVMGGAGTNNRYAGQVDYNRFSEDSQLSLMGMSNNVNIQDFTGGEEMGEDAVSAGAIGQPGLQTVHRGGGHLYRQLSSKTSVMASYQLNHANVTLRENLVRQNFLPEGTAFYYENSQQQNENKGHMLQTTLEHKGSKNTLRLNTSVNYAHTRTAGAIQRQSFSVENSLVNEGERSSSLEHENINLMAMMFYGHRFKKKGRLFTINNRLSVYQNNSAGWSNAFTRFRDRAAEAVHQQNEQENNNLSYNLRFAYTEPLGKKQYLQASYNVSNRRSSSALEVWDVFNEIRQLNDEQSNNFHNTYLTQQAGLTYRLNGKKNKLAIGANLQQSTLGRSLQAVGQEERQRFRNILPSATLNRKFNRNSRLSLQYTTFVREPSINQLQPVVSRFDPLNLLVGNPALRPEYRHQGKLSFNSSSGQSGVFLSTSLTYNYTNNPITAAVAVDEQQVRTTQYVNLRRSNDYAAFVNLGIPLRKLNSQFNLGPYLRQGQSFNFLNGVVGTIRQRSLGGTLDWTYAYKEKLEINLGANVGFTKSAYELSRQRDQQFMNAAYSASLALQVLKGFWFTSDLLYNTFSNPQANFEQAIPVLNFSLSKLLLSNNRAEIKLAALNVLDRNLGISQFASLNYIEQTVQNSLGSYYMLSFTYHLTPREGEQ